MYFKQMKRTQDKKKLMFRQQKNNFFQKFNFNKYN